jgi:hypothetical protein
MSEPSTGKPIVSRVCCGIIGIMRGISPPVVWGEIPFVGVTGVPPGWRTLMGETVASEPDPACEVFNRPNDLAPPNDIPAWLSA